MNTTKRLLTAAATAGPLFVAVSAAQALARDGFDLTRHPLSLLSLGDHGWIQVANFLLAGVLFVAGSVGLRRAMAGAPGGRWAPRLIGAFGVCLIIGGAFPADPADGFPPGTTAPAHPSWHAMVHAMAPATAFLLLALACFVFARFFARRGDRTRAAASVVVGLALFAPDAFLASDGFFVALAVAVVIGWTWASDVAFHLARALDAAPRRTASIDADFRGTVDEEGRSR